MIKSSNQVRIEMPSEQKKKTSIQEQQQQQKTVK